MRTLMAALCVVTAAMTSGSVAAQKPTGKQSPAKGAPTCAALAYRALPSGTTDGEQTAGTYKSRFARLELNATVQSGSPVNYYLAANGKHIPGGAQVPQVAVDCDRGQKDAEAGRTAIVVHRRAVAACLEDPRDADRVRH